MEELLNLNEFLLFLFVCNNLQNFDIILQILYIIGLFTVD